MKNSRRGFVSMLALGLVSLLVLGAGAYLFFSNKTHVAPAETNLQVNATSTQVGLPAQMALTDIPSTPGISSIEPASGPVKTLATLNGFFPKGTSIYFDKQKIGTTEADMKTYNLIIPEQVKATGFGAPPFMLVEPGAHSISLSEGASTNDSVEFTVTPTVKTPPPAGTPIVTSISQSEIVVGQTKEITLYGSNFNSKSMISLLGSGVVTVIAPTYVSPDGSSMTFAFPEALTIPALYSVGVYSIGNTPYYPLSISLINTHAPAVTSISPTSAAVGSTITVYGSNFYSSSRVYLGTYLPSTAEALPPIVPSSYTSTSLTFVIPQNLNPGPYHLIVSDLAGNRSKEVSLTVTK